MGGGHVSLPTEVTMSTSQAHRDGNGAHSSVPDCPCQYWAHSFVPQSKCFRARCPSLKSHLQGPRLEL